MPKSLSRSSLITAIFPADAHRVALDRGLHLQFAVFDLLDDRARLLDGNTLLQGDLLPHRRSGRRDDLAEGQAFERHFPLHQLRLQNIHHRL